LWQIIRVFPETVGGDFRDVTKTEKEVRRVKRIEKRCGNLNCRWIRSSFAKLNSTLSKFTLITMIWMWTHKLLYQMQAHP
jgi:hypothetical protein